MNAIVEAIAARDAFLERVLRGDDPAVLMAEAIAMHLSANGLETVSRDGRAYVCMEDICASHCLKAARDAYALVTP